MASKANSFIRHVLFHNAELKLLAIILAGLSFFAIRDVTSFEKTYEVPLGINIATEEVAILSVPETVEVTVRGSQEDILRLDASAMHVDVELNPEAPSGSMAIELSPKDVKGISSVRVQEIKPPAVTINFDQKVTKEFGVRPPQIIGKAMGTIEIDYKPKTVKIRGPRQRLKTADFVITEPVNVENRLRSFETKLKVVPPGNTWVESIEPEFVDVSVNFVWETVSREYSNLVVNAIVPPGNEAEYRFDPPEVDVILHGRPDVVRRIARDSIKVFVSCGGAVTNDTTRQPVFVHIPPRDNISIKVQPPDVRVWCERRDAALPPADSGTNRADAADAPDMKSSKGGEPAAGKDS